MDGTQQQNLDNTVSTKPAGSDSGSGPRVLIIGGGFGGLAAAKQLRGKPVRVTLLDRRNFHLFQPLLYQVATGVLSPANIASPLRGILRRQKNCEVLLGEVDGFDLAANAVLLSDGSRVEYDWLITAAGATHSYFGHDEWSTAAPGLKTIEDATEIRKRILFAFEAAEQENDPDRRRAWLTFVIVGGGPTGVELAGALSDIANFTLRYDFRRINPPDARIILVESSKYPLDVFGGDLPEKSLDALRKLHVEVRTETKAIDIQPTHVVLKSGENTETIFTSTVIWAAGVKASPLGAKLAAAAGLTVDRAGRIPVGEDLSIAGHPNVMVIGDMSTVMIDGKPLPGLAPVAMQEGQYAAKRILAAPTGKTLSPFRYHDRGTMAVIGRYRAVAQIGTKRFSGLIAWLLWVLIHIVQITQFRNRVLVMTQWAWTFFSRDRSARLITGRLYRNEATKPSEG
ncbi:MAG: NAD(P)/FAD-dependent oxidoreductase [Pirellulales bacterium]